MANDCYYSMKVVGDNQENLEKFFRAMNWEGEYEESGVGRVFSCEIVDEITQREDGRHEMTLSGYCAWSIQSAMIHSFFNDYPDGLPVQSARLNLDIEAFSEESGIAFQELYLFSKGEEIIAECVDWYEIYIYDIMDDAEKVRERIASYDAEKYIESGDYRDYVEGRFVKLGGMDWNFQI